MRIEHQKVQPLLAVFMMDSGDEHMKQGALIFDEQTDRYDIRFDLADYYGGLHCGETFDVMVGGRWRPTRIEMAENWYLVGIHANDLSGLRVRI